MWRWKVSLCNHSKLRPSNFKIRIDKTYSFNSFLAPTTFWHAHLAQFWKYICRADDVDMQLFGKTFRISIHLTFHFQQKDESPETPFISHFMVLSFCIFGVYKNEIECVQCTYIQSSTDQLTYFSTSSFLAVVQIMIYDVIISVFYTLVLTLSCYFW